MLRRGCGTCYAQFGRPSPNAPACLLDDVCLAATVSHIRLLRWQSRNLEFRLPLFFRSAVLYTFRLAPRTPSAQLRHFLSSAGIFPPCFCARENYNCRTCTRIIFRFVFRLLRFVSVFIGLRRSAFVCVVLVLPRSAWACLGLRESAYIGLRRS